MMTSWTSQVRTLITSATAVSLAVAVVSCGGDPAGPPDDGGEPALPMEWTFDSDQEGWLLFARLPGEGSGTASYDAASGRIVLSGYGSPGAPDAWTSREVTLPDVEYLWIDALVSADCLEGGDNDSHLRITATSPANGTQVIQDWVNVDVSPRLEGGSLEAFAGQAVTITIEQDDEGGQESSSNAESICVDMVSIFQD